MESRSSKLDAVRCTLSPDSYFTMRAFMTKAYRSQYDRSLPPLVTDFIWRRRAPPKAQLMVWFLSRDKLKIGHLLVSLNLIP